MFIWVSPTEVVRAGQQLTSSIYTVNYYIFITFPNPPIHMHDPTTPAHCLLVVVVRRPQMKAHPLHHGVR